MQSILTIEEEAGDTRLLTPEEILAAVGDESADPEVLDTLNLRISAALARACKIRIGLVPDESAPHMSKATLRAETIVEQITFHQALRSLPLSRRPVTQIVSVSEGSGELDPSAYAFDASSGLLYRVNAQWQTAWQCQQVTVNYVAGWDVVPDELKMAISTWAAELWLSSKKSDPGLRRLAIPGIIDQEWWVGSNKDPAIPQEIMDLIAPFCDVIVA